MSLAKANFDYKGADATMLSFSEGQTIAVSVLLNVDWL